MIRVSHLSLTSAALIVAAFVPNLAHAASETWEIDPSHSHIGFQVRHMMVTNTRGWFEKFSGKVQYDEKDPSKSTVEVTIETPSLQTADAKRDEHLRSAEFFDVAKY